MKYSLFFVATLISTFVLAQTDSAKFALTFHVNNGLSYRTINADNQNLQALVDDLNEVEKVKFVQGFSVGVSRSAGNNLKIQLGMGYQEMGHRIDSLAGMTDMQQTLSYLQFPLSVEYHFMSDRRVTPFVGLGMQYGMLISDKLEYKVTGANRNFETKDAGIWNRNLVSGVGHLGMAIQVYPKNIFTLAIAGQYGLNSATSTELDRNIYGYNLQLGWRIDF